MQKVVIFRNSCIACGACIAFCPYGALEPDEEGKPVLIWDLCRDDFACVIVCPVAAVKRASEAGLPPPEKWYKVSRAELYPKPRRGAPSWRQPMEVERLVGRRVRVLHAQCEQTADIKTAVGILVHEAGGRLLLRLDDGTDMPIELGWVISITDT